MLHFLFLIFCKKSSNMSFSFSWYQIDFYKFDPSALLKFSMSQKSEIKKIYIKTNKQTNQNKTKQNKTKKYYIDFDLICFESGVLKYNDVLFTFTMQIHCFIQMS